MLKSAKAAKKGSLAARSHLTYIDGLMPLKHPQVAQHTSCTFTQSHRLTTVPESSSNRWVFASTSATWKFHKNDDENNCDTVIKWDTAEKDGSLDSWNENNSACEQYCWDSAIQDIACE